MKIDLEAVFVKSEPVFGVSKKGAHYCRFLAAGEDGRRMDIEAYGAQYDDLKSINPRVGDLLDVRISLKKNQTGADQNGYFLERVEAHVDVRDDPFNKWPRPASESPYAHYFKYPERWEWVHPHHKDRNPFLDFEFIGPLSDNPLDL